MKLRKCLKHAFEMVAHSKLRSWLTILGIVIGVASVIAIVSMGEGMQSQMSDQFSSLGGDILTITPGFSRGGFMGGGPPGERGGSSSSQATDEDEETVLEWSDVQAVKGISNILYIDTQISGSVEAVYRGKSGTVSLTGVDQKTWSKITTLEIADGRLLDATDQNVIVIGGRLASDYFGTEVSVNNMISVEGTSFRVIGILDDQSTQIYMPIQMAYQLVDDSTVGEYDSIVIKVKDEDKLNETIEKLNSTLMITRHVTAKTKDFTVTSSKQMQETRNEMMGTMNTFLLAIAAVSLLVGAVGVANTMFTSVLEKTKEIGIMKAIGARNKDIMLIFLMNAALIGLVGGVLGIIGGTILSGFLPSLLGSSTFIRSSSIVSWNSVFIALSMSVLIGMIAGAIPAYKASKLKPVDALRYE
jgi:putative ABC transport system permease protein